MNKTDTSYAGMVLAVGHEDPFKNAPCRVDMQRSILKMGAHSKY